MEGGKWAKLTGCVIVDCQLKANGLLAVHLLHFISLPTSAVNKTSSILRLVGTSLTHH